MARQQTNTRQNEYNYSLSEQLTGETWIDGKPIYKKTIDFGALPNATTKSVAHGITGMDNPVHCYGRAITGTTMVPLPFVSSNTANGYMTLNIESTSVVVVTGIDRSAFYGYVTIEYTKT